MCEAKPGQRCAADTRDGVVVCMDAYRKRHPAGPDVDPLSAATHTFQEPPAPATATGPSLEPAPQDVHDLMAHIEASYSEDIYGARAGKDTVSARLGIDADSLEDTHLAPMLAAQHAGDHAVAEDYAARLLTIVQRERQWQDSGYQPPGGSSVSDGSIYGPVHTGDRYDPSRPLRDVAKDVRADLKEAVAAGYLPDLDYRVRTRTRGTSAIDVTIEGMDDREASSVSRKWGGEVARSPYAHQVQDRVRGIVGAYTRNQNESRLDYFSNSAWVDAQVVSTTEVTRRRAHDEYEKARAALRKAQRDGTGDVDQLYQQATAARTKYQATRDAVEASRAAILNDPYRQ